MPKAWVLTKNNKEKWNWGKNGSNEKHHSKINRQTHQNKILTATQNADIHHSYNDWRFGG